MEAAALMKEKKALSPAENIEEPIFMIRGHRVLVDAYLADLYGVETRSLIQAVKRDLQRFPPDFMFRVTQKE